MSVLICIDPGHVRNYNRGAYSPYYEGTKMYDLGVMLAEEINKYNGLDAIITRKNVDDNPELWRRGRMATDNGARCFLSLHTNAASLESINQVTVFRSILLPKSEELGRRLMDGLVSLIGKDVPTTPYKSIPTRVIQSGADKGLDYYGVLRWSTKGTSVKESFIIEHVYHTNYNQAKWMYSDANLRKVAKLEAEILAEYYSDPDNKIDDNTTVNNNASSTVASDEYIVKYGDSWWGIAQNILGNGNDMYELANYNNLTINSMLKPGQKLKIPNGKNINTDPDIKKYKTYIVKSGDSWWGIAQNQLGDGFKYRTLAEFNDLKPDSIIRPGDEIKIPL